MLNSSFSMFNSYMNQRRELIILGLLFLALVAFTVLGQQEGSDEQTSARPTTHSSSPAGGLALLRWLDGLGYDARRLEYREFELDTDVAALFVLSPAEAFNRSQTERLLDWVDTGGTLIITEDSPQLFGGGSTVLEALKIETGFYRQDDANAAIERAPMLQPTFSDPPLADLLVRTDQVLRTERLDAVPLAGVADGVVLLGLKQGAGYIYIASASHPFTSGGLRDSANAALVLNMLRRVPPGGTVLFDEYHHGYYAPPSLRALILGNPWGRATIYALAVIALYLLVTGRRFGRPVPLAEEVARRSSAEYVENMADLFQRGGKREFIVRHYYASLKRRLARPFGISPGLNDDQFVRELARYRTLDEPALRDLLARLRRPPASEAELLRLVAEADRMSSR